MARTAAAEGLTEAHRGIQLRIIAGLMRDLAVLWRPVDPTDIRGTLNPFTDAASVVTVAARRASASAAQGYYRMFRQVEGVPGTFDAALAPDPPPDVLRGGLFGAGARGIIDARRRGLDVAAAAQNGLVRASGAAVQIAANGGRETLLVAVLRDPAAIGYQRVTDGDPCAFCRMIASQGIVSYDGSAGFEAHAHCGCTAEPAFEGSQIIPRNAEFRGEWEEVAAGRSGPDALREYRRRLRNRQQPATG